MLSRSLVVAFALLIAMSVNVGRVGTTSAQDATPAVGECDAPALPPGTPTALEEATPEGVTIEKALEDPALNEQIEFIGFGFAAPGEESDAHFVGLEPGVYTMACFVTTPDGEFHVDLGMFAEFEVTAAS
jgi:hypothetical protein